MPQLNSEMEEQESGIPSGLTPGGEGARLWHWLSQAAAGAADCRPAVIELCMVADRLQEVRQKIKTQGLTVSGPRGRSVKHPLIDIEIKLSGQFSKFWKLLGLSDKADDEAPKRPVGRPPDGDGDLFHG